MVARTTAVIVFGLAVGLAGCASDPSREGSGTFPEAPLATIHSRDGLAIEVRTSPDQPPSRGDSSVELRVSDAEGEPAPDLDIDAEPWMPAMGHGAATEPERTVEGDGRYRFDDVELFMPGEWELRLTISGKTSDSATARFTNQLEIAVAVADRGRRALHRAERRGSAVLRRRERADAGAARPP